MRRRLFIQIAYNGAADGIQFKLVVYVPRDVYVIPGRKLFGQYSSN